MGIPEEVSCILFYPLQVYPVPYNLWRTSPLSISNSNERLFIPCIFLLLDTLYILKSNLHKAFLIIFCLYAYHNHDV